MAAKRRRVSRRRGEQLAAAALAVLIAVDAVHLTAIASGVHGPGLVGRFFSIGYASVGAWIAGALAVLWMIARQRPDGIYLVVFAAGTMATTGGLADVGALSNSATSASLSSGVVRMLVALTIGLGAAIVIAGVQLSSTDGPAPRTLTEPGPVPIDGERMR